jgi:hypothetical protein
MGHLDAHYLKPTGLGSTQEEPRVSNVLYSPPDQLVSHVILIGLLKITPSAALPKGTKGFEHGMQKRSNQWEPPDGLVT